MAMCNPRSTSFGTSAGRKVIADFSGGQVTSDTGALLLRDADRKLGLLEKAAKVIPDPRDPAKVEHSQLSVLQQRVYALVLGYEDVIDHDSLCQDFVLQTATGRAEKLAGASTVGRLELRADRKSMWDLHKVLLEDFFDAYTSAPDEIILDLDSTDFTVHGMQQGRHFNAFYDENIFLPLYVFCGRHLLVSYLRPGRVDNMKHVMPIMRLLISEIRVRWPRTRIVVRGDSGFYRAHFLSWMERNRIKYLIGFAQNKALNHCGRHAAAESQKRFEASKEKSRCVDSFFYHAGSWKRPERGKKRKKRVVRKIVVRSETGEKGTDNRYVVTNIKGSSKEIYEDYCARGEMENRIKDAKCHLFASRTSSIHWLANQFRMLLSSLAYTLVEGLRRFALEGTELATVELPTLRTKLFKIGAVIVRNTRRTVVKMAEGYPYKELFLSVAARLRPA